MDRTRRQKPPNYADSISINAMTAQSVYTDNVSVAQGIAATCFAAYDSTRNVGLQPGTAEGMLLAELG